MIFVLVLLLFYHLGQVVDSLVHPQEWFPCPFLQSWYHLPGWFFYLIYQSSSCSFGCIGSFSQFHVWEFEVLHSFFLAFVVLTLFPHVDLISYFVRNSGCVFFNMCTVKKHAGVGLGHWVKDNICHNPVCEIVRWCECSSWLIKCGSLPIWPTNMAEDTGQETQIWQATSIASGHYLYPYLHFNFPNYFSTNAVS